MNEQLGHVGWSPDFRAPPSPGMALGADLGKALRCLRLEAPEEVCADVQKIATDRTVELLHQRNLLGDALRAVLVRLGVLRDDAAPSGPELLLAAQEWLKPEVAHETCVRGEGAGGGGTRGGVILLEVQGEVRLGGDRSFASPAPPTHCASEERQAECRYCGATIGSWTKPCPGRPT